MRGRRHRTALALAPAVLSFLMLSAHFVRGFELLFAVVALLLPLLLLVRSPWAARMVQGALLVGALEWVMTTLQLVGGRQATGEPYGRLILIMGAVVVFTLVSGLLLETSGCRRRYGLRTERFFQPAPADPRRTRE